MNFGPNLADARGKLLPRSYDVLGDAFIVSTFLSFATFPAALFLTVPYLLGIFLLQVCTPHLYFKSQTLILLPLL
jgi:hypothetical protein